MTRYNQLCDYIIEQYNCGNKHPYIKMMLRCIRHKSKIRNLQFNLNIDDIYIPDICPILKVKIYPNIKKGLASDYSPSIDRIDPAKGYTKDNIHIISKKANTIKNNASIEELKLILAYVNNIQ